MPGLPTGPASNHEMVEGWGWRRWGLKQRSTELAAAIASGTGIEGERIRLIEPLDPDTLSDLLYAEAPAPHTVQPILPMRYFPTPREFAPEAAGACTFPEGDGGACQGPKDWVVYWPGEEKHVCAWHAGRWHDLGTVMGMDLTARRMGPPKVTPDPVRRELVGRPKSKRFAAIGADLSREE